jgi:hypothetical protein
MGGLGEVAAGGLSALLAGAAGVALDGSGADFMISRRVCQNESTITTGGPGRPTASMD